MPSMETSCYSESSESRVQWETLSTEGPSSKSLITVTLGSCMTPSPEANRVHPLGPLPHENSELAKS